MSRVFALVTVMLAVAVACSSMFVGMPAPRVLYSCVVRNRNFSQPVEVIVTYQHPFTKEESLRTALLNAGDEKKFEQLLVQDDGATYVGTIQKVSVKSIAAGLSAKPLVITHDQFDISSPTSDYLFEIVSSGIKNSDFEVVQKNTQREETKDL